MHVKWVCFRATVRSCHLPRNEHGRSHYLFGVLLPILMTRAYCQADMSVVAKTRELKKLSWSQERNVHLSRAFTSSDSPGTAHTHT